MAFITISAFQDNYFDGFRGEMVTDEVSIAWTGRHWLWYDGRWTSAYGQEHKQAATDAILNFFQGRSGG